MNIFTDEGYLDFNVIMSIPAPFVFIIGGRGTGKTYGALKWILENNVRFMYMRRTQKEIDLIMNETRNPFAAINDDMGRMVSPVKVSANAISFYECVKDDNGKMVPQGNKIGDCCALSTIASIRGFDASHIDLLLLDEFVKEKHVKAIRAEGQAFLNAYETINRNRELKGSLPVKAVLLANNNELANPLFMELRLVSKVAEMRQKGQIVSHMQKRGILLIVLPETEISLKKKNTALYRMVGNESEFYEMSIENTTNVSRETLRGSRPLKEYVPVVFIGELAIYKHKSDGHYYATTHRSGTAPSYGIEEIDIERFKRAFSFLWLAYVNNNIIFEEVFCESLLTKYFHM